MAFLSIPNVAVKGISACVPATNEFVIDIYESEGVESFLNSTGIYSRRHAPADVCSSDLCCKAAEKLIDSLGWNKDEIDVLVFVTQTPDYILPATSTVLHRRLGLSSTCYTLDISLGCSGWVYAMSVITSLIQNGTMRKGLLLAGDTILKICSPCDKSTYPLFGDAGTATAVEYSETASPIRYVMNTDGEGYETIIVKEGGYRNPVTSESFVCHDEGESIKRNGLNLVLDGMNVFSFSISKAPKSVNQLLEHFNIDKESVDIFTFHQANMLMNEKIRKKLKLSEEKVPYSIHDFANTSCASIPLTLVTQERERLRTEKLRHVACGFGVGLSWGSVYFETENIKVPELIEL